MTTQGIRTTVIEPGAVDTELATHVPDEQVLERFAEMDLPMLHPDDIARGIVYATSQPARVDVNELLISRPGRISDRGRSCEWETTEKRSSHHLRGHTADDNGYWNRVSLVRSGSTLPGSCPPAAVSFRG